MYGGSLIHACTDTYVTRTILFPPFPPPPPLSIELVQDLDFPAAAGGPLRLTADGNFLLGVGVHPPQVRGWLGWLWGGISAVDTVSAMVDGVAVCGINRRQLPEWANTHRKWVPFGTFLAGQRLSA